MYYTEINLKTPSTIKISNKIYYIYTLYSATNVLCNSRTPKLFVPSTFSLVYSNLSLQQE